MIDHSFELGDPDPETSGEEWLTLADQLAETPVGPELGTLLGTLDRTQLDTEGLLRLAQARVRQVAHLQAQLLADLHAVARAVPDQGSQPGRRDQPGKYPWAEVETACALRWTYARAGGEMVFADDIIDRLPAIFAALDAGRIDIPKARVLTDLLACVDDTLATALVDKIIERATTQTTGELRARLRRLLLAADAQLATKQARHAIQGRHVAALDHPDNHLATLSGHDLAPHRVAAVMERLNAIARAAKAAGDTRSTDQLRADAYLDLLTGDGIANGNAVSDGAAGITTPDPTAEIPPTGTTSPALAAQTPTTTPTRPAADASAGHAPLPGPRPGVVELQVPLVTLLKLSDLPGELTGWGPVLADISRQVTSQMHDAQWRFSVYDRLGELAHHGTTSARPTTTRPTTTRPTGAQPTSARPTGAQPPRSHRRPTSSQAAFVRSRDRTCVAPGCRRPATQCDLDHTKDWIKGGDTHCDNLGLLCKRHHMFKHTAGCQLQQVSPGVFIWSTPAGMHYLTTPDRPLIDDREVTDHPIPP